MAGAVASLNVSVATGIVLFELLRQAPRSGLSFPARASKMRHPRNLTIGALLLASPWRVREALGTQGESLLRDYQVVFLVDPDQSEQVPAMLERFPPSIQGAQGKIHPQEDWGAASCAPHRQGSQGPLPASEHRGRKADVDELVGAFRSATPCFASSSIARDEAITEPLLMAKAREEDRRARRRRCRVRRASGRRAPSKAAIRPKATTMPAERPLRCRSRRARLGAPALRARSNSTETRPMARFSAAAILPLHRRRREEIDYKDLATLKDYVTETGKIVPSRITGTHARYQRQLATAIKRARFLALLPYTDQH